MPAPPSLEAASAVWMPEPLERSMVRGLGAAAGAGLLRGGSMRWSIDAVARLTGAAGGILEMSVS
jgi:hypothetical protein